MICEVLEDPMLRILIVAAILSIIIEGIFAETEEDKATFWVEGTTILAAVLVVTTVSVFNDI